MAPVVDPLMAGGGFTLSNFIGVVDRNCIYATAMDIKGFTKIFHAHGGAFDMPARISSSPWGVPHHSLLAELAVGEP